MSLRGALVITGVLIMGYAAAGALTDPDLAPAGVLLFLAGALIGHDFIWMPVVIAVGAVITRFVPRWRRPAVIAATVSAASITVVALPLVLGFGHPADNPSALPLPYGRNLALVLLVIIAVTALWRRRPGGRKKSERPGGDVRASGDG
jgi:MFS family permease